MKRLLIILSLLVLPLSASAAEVTITDYEGSQIQVQIPDFDYNLMTKWNQQAPSLGYPLMKAIPYKGPVGFSIGGKASFHTLFVHSNKIELVINPGTTITEAQNFARLLKKCTEIPIEIELKY